MDSSVNLGILDAVCRDLLCRFEVARFEDLRLEYNRRADVPVNFISDDCFRAVALSVGVEVCPFGIRRVGGRWRR